MINNSFLNLPWVEGRFWEKQICLGTALDGGKGVRQKTLFTQHRLYPTLTQDFKRFNLVLSSANPGWIQTQKQINPKKYFNNTNVFTTIFLDPNKNIFLVPPILPLPNKKIYHSCWLLMSYIVKQSIHPSIHPYIAWPSPSTHPPIHQSIHPSIAKIEYKDPSGKTLDGTLSGNPGWKKQPCWMILLDVSMLKQYQCKKNNWWRTFWVGFHFVFYFGTVNWFNPKTKTNSWDIEKNSTTEFSELSFFQNNWYLCQW